MPKLIAGDIGGTKTVLAIYSHDSGPGFPLAEETFRSADYTSLEAVVQEFFAHQHVTGADFVSGTFGVAGPVVDGEATITNLPWQMDEIQLAATLTLPKVTLINDLVAVANAVPGLPATDLHTLNEGHAVENGPIAVIAPGTGLGEAYLIHNGTHYEAYPSEGGHADFAPNNETEVALLQFLQTHLQKPSDTGNLAHISWERVCSGSGIPNIYAYFKQSGIADEDPTVAEEIAQGADIAPTVINAALRDNPCLLCLGTLNTFVGILGAEAGNMALKVLSTGGVYLGGGIPPRLLSALEQPIFMNTFLNKGRLFTVLEAMPVRVILNPKAALFGAAYHGLLQHQLS